MVWSSDNPAGRSQYMGGSNGPWRGSFCLRLRGRDAGSGHRALAGEGGGRRCQRRDIERCRLAAHAWPLWLERAVGCPLIDRSTVSTPRRSLLGESPKSGRDHVIFYGSDSGVMSVKWKTMKVVLRYCESNSGVILKPQWPLIFDLIDDPDRGNGPDRQASGLCLGDETGCHGAWERWLRVQLSTPISSQGRISPVTRRLTVEQPWSTSDLYG